MIVFLTLLYIGVLAILLKLKVIRLTLWWKLSPLVWMVLLLVVLFIPMQWGAPSGSVVMFQQVVEIIPNVSGEVIEVKGTPLKPMQKGDVIFRIDPEPYEHTVADLAAKLRLAEMNRERARDLVKKDFAARFQLDQYTAEAESLMAQLNKAKFDLQQTTVRAPADGFIIALTLRPGQRVVNLPLRSWVAFVRDNDVVPAVGINQILLRHIKVGDPVEIAFKLLPGKVINARVDAIAYMTPQGQLQPSGLVPSAPTGREPPAPFGVRLALEDSKEVEEVLRLSQLPGGAVGTAAIYTKSVKATHIIRKVMIRMDAWMNYIIPF